MTSCRARSGSRDTHPPGLQGPTGPGTRARGSQEPPGFARAPYVERPRTQHFSREPPPQVALRPASTRGDGEEKREGGGGRDPSPLDSAHPRVRRDIPPGPGRAALARPLAETGAGAGPGSTHELLRPLRASGPARRRQRVHRSRSPSRGTPAAAGAHRSTFLSPAKRLGAARAWRASVGAEPARGTGRGLLEGKRREGEGRGGRGGRGREGREGEGGEGGAGWCVLGDAVEISLHGT
jgi:hypothetical protein